MVRAHSLGNVPRNPGERTDLTSFHDGTKLITYEETLKQNDLAPITAHRWQLEADVPEEQLAQFIAEATAKADEITSREVLSMAMKIKNESKKETTSSVITS